MKQAKCGLKVAGTFHFEQWRDGKLIHEESVPNGVVDLGKNDTLDVYFFNATQSPTWYLGFIDNAGFTALADADTAASHAGWAEATGYSEPNRPTWVTTAAASQSITNPTPATFSVTSLATIKGIAIWNDNVKSGTGGLLWASALFAGDIPVDNGDIIKISYTVNAV